jgi:hypothetical protein
MVAGIRTGTIGIGFSGWTARGVPPRYGVKQQGDRILITPFDKAVVPPSSGRSMKPASTPKLSTHRR